MKAPDKIYVNPDLDCPWTDEECFGDVEYLRKDYLLEWAKGEQNKYSNETHPYAMFMNVVIDKLNEI